MLGCRVSSFGNVLTEFPKSRDPFLLQSVQLGSETPISFCVSRLGTAGVTQDVLGKEIFHIGVGAHPHAQHDMVVRLAISAALRSGPFLLCD